MVSLKLSMMWSLDKFQGPPQLMVTALGIEVEMVFGVFHAIFYHTFIIGHSQVLGNSIHAHFKMNITISIIIIIKNQFRSFRVRNRRKHGKVNIS